MKWTYEALIALLTLICGFVGAVIYRWVNINIKFSELSRDYIGLRKDFEEHKSDNCSDIDEIKKIVIENRKEHREDMSEIKKMLMSIIENK